MGKDRVWATGALGVLWIAANTLSWASYIWVGLAAGWVLWQAYLGPAGSLDLLANDGSRTLAALIISFLCWGAIVGALQQAILRRRFVLEGNAWVLATVAGLTLSRVLRNLAILAELVGVPFKLAPAADGILIIVSACALGIAQWLVLRRSSPRSAWWIAAPAIAAWGAGWAAIPATSYARSILPAGGTIPVVLPSMVSFSLEGLIYGVVTLAGLAALSSRPSAATVEE